MMELGYDVEIDIDYDEEEEFRRPGYAHGLRGHLGSRYGELPEGGYAGGSVGGARAVSKKGKVSAQADGPCGYVGSGANENEVFAGGEGSLWEAEAHAGPFGVGVQGPGGGAKAQAGKKGLKVDGGASLASGNVQAGPVKLGAGVGIEGALRLGYGGVGAIVPGLGGAVVAKDGFQLAAGPFNFKIGW